MGASWGPSRLALLSSDPEAARRAGEAVTYADQRRREIAAAEVEERKAEAEAEARRALRAAGLGSGVAGR